MIEPLKRPLRKIVVVFKTHFDLGFTALPEEVMSLYRGEMFTAVREVMDATAHEREGLRYAWTLPSWPLKQLLHGTGVPAETRAAARDLVVAGRLHWHAWPFTTHTAFCGLEDMVRGLHISRALSQEFGRSPASAKQTDVPGHTWIYPTLLARAGVRFLHLGVNPGSHSPHVPTLYWWDGPDGARLLTWYSHGGYGSSLLPPDDWAYDTWLAVRLTVENTGPQSAEEMRQMRLSVEQHAPGVELVFGQLDDFADSLLEDPGQLESLPTLPYDLADSWIHGIGTMPRGVARVRTLRQKLLHLECVAACFQWPDTEGQGQDRAHFGLASEVAPYIDEAYEQLLLFGEHTWGLDVKSTIEREFGQGFKAARQSEAYRRLETSWVVKEDYVGKAEAAYARAQEIARRAGAFRSEGPQSNHAARPDQADSPVMKYEGAPQRPKVLEGGGLRVEVDPASGCIVSLRETGSGREWVDHTNPEPFGGYRYDLYSAEDIAEYLRAYGRLFQPWFMHDFGKSGYPEETPHVTAYARGFKLSHVSDGQGKSLLLTGGTLHATGPGAELLPTQTISIRMTPSSSKAGGLILDYRIEGKEATSFTESTIVPFPLKLPKATFRLGQVGSVIDPARDIAEGANRHLWCADWVDVSDDRAGIAIAPVDMPLVSIGDTGIYKFKPDRVPAEPVVYAHLSNTQWGTNFPQWLEGDFIFRIMLLPHPGDWRTGNVWERARYAGSRGFRLEGAGSVRDLSHCIELPEGWALQSIRPGQDGRGLVVRYWDALGVYRREDITLYGPVGAVWRCDLMERPIERLDARLVEGHEKGQATLVSGELSAHGIETLLVEFH